MATRFNLDVEPTITYYNPESFYETSSGVKLGKKSHVRGTDQIQTIGKLVIQEGVVVRGDLSNIKLGRYSIICEGVILHPPYKRSKGQIKFIPISVGDHTLVEENTIVSAAKIGTCCHIGKNCILSPRCIISDYVKILDDTLVPADMVIPPFTVYGGKPASFMSELPETAPLIHMEQTMNYYRNFVPKAVPKEGVPTGPAAAVKK
eukprot:TRINITY_DN2883_c0_g1_i3.p2 TRINITY_DN2883_c0_g1~~TRINITY_DN2883_c0_g1_i3.p2  ORF type:complete len:205 (+),score=47.02 TRINITY_DN2883_c0_g1_i3:189-803(+)